MRGLPTFDRRVGAHHAIMFMRDCGTTTDYTTQISIDPSLFNGAGNAFVADGGARRGSWQGPWAELTWMDDRHLLIRYDSEARVFVQETTWGAVDIVYEPVTHP